jgi:hypothetical protein
MKQASVARVPVLYCYKALLISLFTLHWYCMQYSVDKKDEFVIEVTWEVYYNEKVFIF